MKRWLIIVAVVVAGGGLYYWMSHRPIELETVHPSIGTVREFVDEDAKTRLDEDYTVSMPINGRILRIDLEEGDYVTSGEIIARVDDFPLRKKIDELQARIAEVRSLIVGVDEAKPKPEDIEAARVRVNEAKLRLENAQRRISEVQINLEEAKRDFERMKNLLAEGVVQKAQYDEAKRQYETLGKQLEQAQIGERVAERAYEVAQLEYQRVLDSVDDNEYMRSVYEAQIEQAQSNLAVTRDDLSKTTITAPVTGIVTEKQVEDEQVLAAGTPLLTIGDMSTIEIESDILSEEITQVREGQPVEILGKVLLGRTLEGRVKRIYPSGFKKYSALGIEQQRVKVIISFDNGEVNLRPEVSVDVRIIVNEAGDVLTVPEKAIFKDSDRWAVFVIENGELQLRPIEIGLRNDELVEIRSGLKESDIVVTEPANDLEPGVAAEPVS